MKFSDARIKFYEEVKAFHETSGLDPRYHRSALEQYFKSCGGNPWSLTDQDHEEYSAWRQSLVNKFTIIERGVVVKAIEVSNRPTHQDASEIKKFVESRGIMSLLHFTRVANVPEILKHGLLGRESIVTRGLSASFNDQYRYDNAADSVCASISFPNYKMFYSLQQRSLDDDWVVLRLNPKILWEIPCAYCFSNAASSKVTKIPIEERMRFKALASMFEDIPPSIMRSSLGIPDEYTTDPQAEVLILAPVDPSYILDINVNQKNQIKDMETMQNLFKLFSNRFKFQHDGSLFTYRKDYEYWR